MDKNPSIFRGFVFPDGLQVTGWPAPNGKGLCLAMGTPRNSPSPASLQAFYEVAGRQVGKYLYLNGLHIFLIYICLECIGHLCTNRYEYRKLYIYMYNINNMIYTYICTIVHKYTRTKKYIHIHVNLDVIFSTVIQSYPVALEVFSLDIGCKAWTVGTMVGAPVTSKQDSLCEMQVVVVGLDNESFREILDKAYLQRTCSTFLDLRLVLKFGRFHRFLFLENTTKSHRYSHDIHWFMFWFHYRIRWMATLTCVGLQPPAVEESVILGKCAGQERDR